MLLTHDLSSKIDYVERDKRIDWTEAHGTFCQDRNICFLDWGGIYMSLCHLTIPLRTVHFILCIRSDQISRSVVSNSLRPHESQHARPPCPPPTPGVHPDPRPSSQWCHPAISSSVVPFSSCPQSLPTSESFPMSQLFAWPKYWCFSFSIIPSKEIPGLISFRMDWLDPLQSKGLSRVFSNTTVQKHQFFCTQPSSQSNSHIHTWPLENP